MNQGALRLGLEGRVVLITGGGAGIGRASALAFGRGGASVMVTDLDGDAAEAVADGLSQGGAPSHAMALDVADEAEVEQVVAAAIERFGRIDVLVNNAGIGARMATLDLPTERWNRVLEVGLNGTFYCSRAAARSMIAQGRGAIVNVASIMGLSGGGLYPNPAYHAAKGGIVNLTRALALEWAAHGIRVNAVAPAFTRTALVEPLLADNRMMDAIIGSTPLGRLVEPEEIADAVVFLASDAATMITGHTLPVDGGWLAR
jgi:NAD(P)-dependent dehydrogenase (short-subunit alcohol dehydrogenase family)